MLACEHQVAQFTTELRFKLQQLDWNIEHFPDTWWGLKPAEYLFLYNYSSFIGLFLWLISCFSSRVITNPRIALQQIHI